TNHLLRVRTHCLANSTLSVPAACASFSLHRASTNWSQVKHQSISTRWQSVKRRCRFSNRANDWKPETLFSQKVKTFPPDAGVSCSTRRRDMRSSGIRSSRAAHRNATCADNVETDCFVRKYL